MMGKEPKSNPKQKSDFDKQYKHLVKTINLLKVELADAKKLAETNSHKKKLEVAIDRILLLI